MKLSFEWKLNKLIDITFAIFEIKNYLQVAHEKPYEDPRYQPEFMSSFGNGVRNRDSNRSSTNRSRHQSNSSEVWNTMEEERRQPQHSKNHQPFRSASSFGIQSGKIWQLGPRNGIINNSKSDVGDIVTNKVMIRILTTKIVIHYLFPL